MKTEEMEKRSEAYSGSYDRELKESYSKLKERPDFVYEASADPAYRAYKDSYVRQGRLAMKDSMAQAAHLSGGYGSSYAQNLGQQQYGAYLEKLSQAMPELYSAAYERYKAEGDRLLAGMNAAAALSESEYRRYADGEDRLSEAEKFKYQQKQDAYKNLASLIASTGYQPSDEELAAGGMSRSQAEALGYEFMRVNGLLPPDQGAGGYINYYNLSPTSPFDIGYREGMFSSAESVKNMKNK